MRFFLKIVLGIVVGTILHEVYHYIQALIHHANPHIVLGIGVGVRSTYHSSEFIAFSITGLFTILGFIYAVRTQ